MSKRQPDYFAYLVRIWHVEDERQGVWRASAQSPSTGETLGFGSLEQLFAFLQTQAMGSTENAVEQTWPLHEFGCEKQ